MDLNEIGNKLHETAASLLSDEQKAAIVDCASSSKRLLDAKELKGVLVESGLFDERDAETLREATHLYSKLTESELSDYQMGVVEDLVDFYASTGANMDEVDITSEFENDEDFDIESIDAAVDYFYELYDERVRESTRQSNIDKIALREAAGNVDKLYASFDKARSTIEKAVNAVLDIADVMEDILVEATAIGGKIEEIVPSHIESIIANVTQLAENQLQSLIDGNSQSSIESLKDMVGSIPYRDLKPETKEEKIAKISMRPNLSQGPRSSVLGQNGGNQVQESTMPQMLSMESLREADGIGINPDVADPNDFSALNAGLTGGAAPYISPIETGERLRTDDLTVDTSALSPDGAPLAGPLSMETIDVPTSAGGLTFDAIGNSTGFDGSIIPPVAGNETMQMFENFQVPKH